MAAFLQTYWADNQVSCTVTFDPETEGCQIAPALAHFQYSLKGISLLPRTRTGAYAQMPYEACSADEYARRCAAVLPLIFGAGVGEDAVAEKYCDGDACLVGAA